MMWHARVFTFLRFAPTFSVRSNGSGQSVDLHRSLPEVTAQYIAEAPECDAALSDPLGATTALREIESQPFLTSEERPCPTFVRFEPL